MAIETLADKWYDTEESVKKSCASLEEFNKLMDARREAGYERHERLKEFLVLDGKYWLDTCGNAHKRIDKSTFSGSSDVPLPDLKCNHCGKGWTIENIDDVVVWEDYFQKISLADFVGQTFADIKKHFHSLTDAIYRMQPETLIRNDAHIDLSPKYPDAEEDWKKRQVKNEFGWLGVKDGITDEYVIKKGDDGRFNIWKYFHKACNRKNLEETYREKFRQIFEAAGFKDIRISAIENQYCKGDHCAPWYHVNTENGTILIGWRKRVINIDWSNLAIDEEDRYKEMPNHDLSHLFEKENVTKGRTSIHAWGWGKAKEYLARIYEQIKS